MSENVVTHGGQHADDRRARLCKCSRCKVIERCRPDFDFYGGAGEPLVCEKCFGAELARQGLKLIEVDAGEAADLGGRKLSPAAQRQWRQLCARRLLARLSVELHEAEATVFMAKHKVGNVSSADLKKARHRALGMHEAIERVKRAMQQI